MIVGYTYRDLVEMHSSLVLAMARSPNPKHVEGGLTDIVKQTITVASINNIVFAQQCTFEDFDLGQVGFGLHRWRRFIREYIDVESYQSWVRQAKQIAKNGSELVFLAKQIGRKETVVYNGTSTKLYGGGYSHRWGNCLLGMTFRLKPYPILTMQSRTSALTKGGVLDLSLASIAARNLGAELGIPPTSIQFCWMAASFQVSSWQLVPLATSWNMVEEICDLDTPTGNSFRKYAIGRGRDYKYASSQRAIAKADSIAAGTMPQTLVSSLEVK